MIPIALLISLLVLGVLVASKKLTKPAGYLILCGLAAVAPTGVAAATLASSEPATSTTYTALRAQPSQDGTGTDYVALDGGQTMFVAGADGIVHASGGDRDQQVEVRLDSAMPRAEVVSRRYEDLLIIPWLLQAQDQVILHIPAIPQKD